MSAAPEPAWSPGRPSRMRNRAAVSAVSVVLLLAGCSDDGDEVEVPEMVRGDVVPAAVCPADADIARPRPQARPLPGPADAYLVCIPSLGGVGEPVRMARGTEPFRTLDAALAVPDGRNEQGLGCPAIGYVQESVFALTGGRVFDVRAPVDGCGLYQQTFRTAVAAAVDLLPVAARASIALDQPVATALVHVGEVLEVTAEGGEAVSPADPRMRVIREGPLTPPSVSLFYALEPGVAVLTARNVLDPTLRPYGCCAYASAPEPFAGALDRSRHHEDRSTP